MPQLCPSLHCTFPPSVRVLLSLKRLTQSQHTYIHTHSLSLSLSLPFLSPSCSGRATNNCSPLYLLLHHTISDQCALVLSAISPSHSQTHMWTIRPSYIHQPLNRHFSFFPPPNPPLHYFECAPLTPIPPPLPAWVCTLPPVISTSCVI